MKNLNVPSLAVFLGGFFVFLFLNTAVFGIFGKVGKFITHPRIKISHNGQSVTIQTTKPLLRAAQLGCIAATKNVAACAPDVIENNSKAVIKTLIRQTNAIPKDSQVELVAVETCKQFKGPECESAQLAPALEEMIPAEYQPTFLTNPAGIPTGMAIAPCSCYYPPPTFSNGVIIPPNTRVQDARCSSGWSAPVFCYGACSPTGRPWTAVCQ